MEEAPPRQATLPLALRKRGASEHNPRQQAWTVSAAATDEDGRAARAPRPRRHSSTAADDVARFHREEVAAGNDDGLDGARGMAKVWKDAAPPQLGPKRVTLEQFHKNVVDPTREQNLVSLLMTEIVAQETDASRYLRGAEEQQERGKRSRLTLWVITVFIYLVQIGAAFKLLGNGRTFNTAALILSFTEGLGNVYNVSALNEAVAGRGEEGEVGLLSLFDSQHPVERQFSQEEMDGATQRSCLC